MNGEMVESSKKVVQLILVTGGMRTTRLPGKHVLDNIRIERRSS